MRRSSSPKEAPLSSRSPRTQPARSWPDHTPEPSLDGVNLAPSSAVQAASISGRAVTTSASASVRITSSPAMTPKVPSKRPPRVCESRCDPIITGAAASSRPPRRPKMLPISSTTTLASASLSHAASWSLALLSSSPSARRVTPPPGVAPISAIRSKAAFNRRPSIRSSWLDILPPVGRRIVTRSLAEGTRSACSLRIVARLCHEYQTRETVAKGMTLESLHRKWQSTPPRRQAPSCSAGMGLPGADMHLGQRNSSFRSAHAPTRLWRVLHAAPHRFRLAQPVTLRWPGSPTRPSSRDRAAAAAW